MPQTETDNFLGHYAHDSTGLPYASMKSKLIVIVAVVAALAAGFFLGQWQVKRSVDGTCGKIGEPVA